MKKFNITVLNVFAILGVILFLVLFVCAAFIANNNPNFSSLILPIVQIILGVLTIIFALIFTKRAYHLFIGMFLLFWGFVIMLAIQNFIPYSVYQWWPVLGISSGFFIFLSGLYKYKKINFGYLLPSLVLFLLGIYFMLFSRASTQYTQKSAQRYNKKSTYARKYMFFFVKKINFVINEIKFLYTR